MLFPPLDKRNTCDKAQGLRVTSERHIGELGVTRSSPRGARYGLWERTFFTRTVTRKARLRTLNRGQDSVQQPQSPRYSAVVMERRVTVGRAVVMRAGAF